jgi:hypothetical protein
MFYNYLNGTFEEKKSAKLSEISTYVTTQKRKGEYTTIRRKTSCRIPTLLTSTKSKEYLSQELIKPRDFRTKLTSLNFSRQKIKNQNLHTR